MRVRYQSQKFVLHKFSSVHYNTFRWVKISPSLATSVLQKLLVESIFTNVVKVAVSSIMQSLTEEKKFSTGKYFHVYGND
jgi:hypothetical protein